MPVVGSAGNRALNVNDNELVIDTPDKLAALRAKFEQPKIQVRQNAHVESLCRMLLELSGEITQMKQDIADIKRMFEISATKDENAIQSVGIEICSRRCDDDVPPTSNTQTKSAGSIMSSVCAILDSK